MGAENQAPDDEGEEWPLVDTFDTTKVRKAI